MKKFTVFVFALFSLSTFANGDGYACRTSNGEGGYDYFATDNVAEVVGLGMLGVECSGWFCLDHGGANGFQGLCTAQFSDGQVVGIEY